jgi:NAD+ kinase
MSKRSDIIALTGNFRDQRALDSINILAEHLVGRGLTVRVESRVAADGLPAAAQIVDEAELASGARLMIAVGGDGTMLYAARAAASAGIPLLGINRGRLGFLADVSPTDMRERLDGVLDGDFESEHRMLLEAKIVADEGDTDCGLALNDVVVKRHDTGRMFEFQTFIDGCYVNTHRGDGFIIATPTGSTAYALSCGGPIVAPGLDAIVLVPICPHTLSDRPLVIPATSVTEVRLADEDTETAEVSCDGEVTGRVRAGQRLSIAAAAQRVELVHPLGYDYYQILRSKLRWGRGDRAPTSDR